MIGPRIPDAERAVLRLAMPSARRLAPSVLFGLLWAVSAISLLATSAYLITSASIIIHILLLQLPIVGVRAFAIGRSVFRYLERLAGHDASFRQLAELRAGILERLLPIAPAGLGATRRGDLLARLVADVDELQFLPLRVVQPVLVALIACAGACLGVAVVSPAAALILALCLAASALVAVAANERFSGRSEREIAPLRAALGERIDETITGLETLAAYGAVDERLARIRAADRAYSAAIVRRAAGQGLVAGAMTLFSGLAMAGALLVGAGDAARGELSAAVAALVAWDPLALFDAFTAPQLAGPLLTLVVLVPMATFEVWQAVPQAVAAWRGVRASAARIADVAPAERPAEIPTELPAGEGAPIPDGPLRLELRGLSARWPGGPVALGPVDLVAEPGARVLVAGPSGAGKSTFAAVLVRFLDHEGDYLLGGVDARDAAPAEVRRRVGLIEQRPHLFADSIRQNLLFARPEASPDDLLAALERVGLGDWARERGGLDSAVGERGALLSGGQAQRLALARALLAEFPILVLDEPTANVDPPRAEALVRELVEAAGPERTVILISHTPVDPSIPTVRLDLAAPASVSAPDSVAATAAPPRAG